jgi:hypothetical protein
MCPGRLIRGSRIALAQRGEDRVVLVPREHAAFGGQETLANFAPFRFCVGRRDRVIGADQHGVVGSQRDRAMEGFVGALV